MLIWHKWAFLTSGFQKRWSPHVRLSSVKYRLINIYCRELVLWFAILSTLCVYFTTKQMFVEVHLQWNIRMATAVYIAWSQTDPKYSFIEYGAISSLKISKLDAPGWCTIWNTAFLLSWLKSSVQFCKYLLIHFYVQKIAKHEGNKLGLH